ncbi:metallophosphoesterase family protein [Candidatus Lucifugimonas marina]|uniref:Phosphoesterase n=1 Tax=Candidatus Lucifugimonas marina TaxID=3038979 RepID=A0AAJ5ZGB1_9CHLR|nr:phosphoesterase [SAR202 cluster bacterium JH702]MDG0869309.1 phosphoesterase [SAR202 cluster bacterium JH639]WFG36710.1 phosphoesterase [SAR202 cluster bacterium JH545]WFG40644.1 phosphoesterase [SAR202 cluster bacterium JH1073]
MDSFRFVHAADLHIDSPFAGVGDADNRVATRLREATYEAFQNLVDLCINQNADFLVIAGDVYDGADRSVRAQLRFRDGLSKLAEAGIQSFVVHGNHDPLDGWQSSISWPEGVHVFGATPEWKNFEKNGEVVAAVQGMSYPTREVTENLAIQFAPPESGNLFAIGLLHANVGANSAHPNYAPCTVEDLSGSGIDYWALGHVHTRQTLKRAAPVIAYPGNTQGRHPNETGARGALVVDVDPSGASRSDFVALDVVRWERSDVDISSFETIDSLDSAIRQATDNLSVQAEDRDVVCRLNIVGRGPLHEQLAADGAVDDLLDSVRNTWNASGSPWVWVERITDSTRPAIDIEARAKQDDFLGATLKRALLSSIEADEIDRLTEVVSDVYTGRRNGLDKPSDEQVSAWAEEARWYLAELLEQSK